MAYIKKIGSFIIPTNAHYHTHEPRYHINRITGDDSNDGLTEATAWASIDRFFQLLNEGHSDIRCYIDAAGDYTFNKGSNIEDAVIHISNKSDGNVTIKWAGNNDRNEFAIYNSHINFNGDDNTPKKNTKLFFNGPAYDIHLTLENTACALSDCYFTNWLYVDMFGCYANATNTGYTRLYLDGSNANFQNTELYNFADEKPPVVVRRNSNASFYGSLNLNGSGTFNTHVFNVERSVLRVLNSTVTGNVVLTGYVAYVTSGIVTLSDDVRARYQNVTGGVSLHSASMHIKQNVTVGE